MKIVKDGKKQQVEKTKNALLYHNVVRMMNGTNYAYKHFPRKYMLIEHSPGICEPVYLKDEQNKVVEFCSEAQIRRDIMKWAWNYGPTSQFQWETRQAKECLSIWLDLTEALKMPKAACFSNEDDYCFVKHDWKPDFRCETPIFDEICGRMSNHKSFMAFIGSFFVDSQTYNQQYLWLKGSGQDAKGCLTRLVKKILGPACRSANPPVRGQNPGFWLDGIMKAKAVVFSDIEDRDFITTGLGKSLTGGDIQSCEKKFGSTYDAKFEGKLIFTSNWMPNISSEYSDQRRIILCELQEKKNHTYDPKYEDKLWKEAPGIVDKCLAEYESLCPRGGPIPTNNENAMGIADDNEDEFYLFMENYNVVQKLDFSRLNKNPYMKQSTLTAHMRSFFRTNREKQAFKKWLTRKYAGRVTISSVKIDGVTKKVVLGMTEKYTAGKV